MRQVYRLIRSGRYRVFKSITKPEVTIVERKDLLVVVN